MTPVRKKWRGRDTYGWRIRALGASNHDRWVDLWDRHAGAVHAYAVVQCSRGDRLRLLDVGRDRWLDLPLQPKPVVTSLWNGRDLYAITADGHLLVLR